MDYLCVLLFFFWCWCPFPLVFIGLLLSSTPKPSPPSSTLLWMWSVLDAGFLSFLSVRWCTCAVCMLDMCCHSAVVGQFIIFWKITAVKIFHNITTIKIFRILCHVTVHVLLFNLFSCFVSCDVSTTDLLKMWKITNSKICHEMCS